MLRKTGQQRILKRLTSKGLKGKDRKTHKDTQGHTRPLTIWTGKIKTPKSAIQSLKRYLLRFHQAEKDTQRHTTINKTNTYTWTEKKKRQSGIQSLKRYLLSFLSGL